MIESSYPYAEDFQLRLLTLFLKEPEKSSAILEPQFFTNPCFVDIARIIRDVYKDHPKETVHISKTVLKELVRASLHSKDQEHWPHYREVIRKIYQTKLGDKELLLDQARKFAKETRYRNALVEAERCISAGRYDLVRKAIEDADRFAEDHRGGSAVELPVFNLHHLLATEFETSEDYLVEPIVPPGGAVLSLGLPKGLKSWFDTGVALDAATGVGKALGYFNVPRPVRVLLVQVEDSASRTKSRLERLREARPFRKDPYPGDLKIVTRCQLNLNDPIWFVRLEEVIAKQKTELLILDVLRRLFRGDVNSAEDAAAFLEKVDVLRDKYKVAVWIVHHSNKKSESEMMTRALGSINWTAWADVLLYFKHKQQSNGITTCNLEIETKDESVEGELKVILDDEAEPMLRVEKAKPAEDKLQKAMSQLKNKWTVDNLAEVLGLKYAGAYKVLQSWLNRRIAVLVRRGSKGHQSRYRFEQITAE